MWIWNGCPFSLESFRVELAILRVAAMLTKCTSSSEKWVVSSLITNMHAVLQ